MQLTNNLRLFGLFSVITTSFRLSFPSSSLGTRVHEALLRRPAGTRRQSRLLRGLTACVGRMQGPGSRASRVCVPKPELRNERTNGVDQRGVWFFVTQVAIAVVALFATPAWSQDKVFPLTGIGVNGKIIERTKDKVVIEVRGANQSFDTHQIARVVFDGEPQQLSRAKDLIVQGLLDEAIAEFQKCPKDGFKTEDIKQDYQFFKGYLVALNALRGKGDAPTATKLLLDWVKDNRTSHLFYMASEKLGDLAMASGTPDQAAKYFGVLAASTFPELKVKGSYLTGKALLANKQTPDARSKFDIVTQAQLADAESLKFKKLASLALIRCDAADGKSPQAIAALEKMVDEGDSTDSELFSELFNALGGILQASGNNDEAILAYLKTDLLYANEPDAHAEALYHLSQLWPMIGESQRATETKSRLSKLYPTSPWLKK